MNHGLALALEVRAGERQLALGFELREVRARVLARQEHGVAQVRPRGRIGQDRSQELPLRFLQALLVALRKARLGSEFLRPRHQAAEALAGKPAQLLQAHEPRAARGEGVVSGERVVGHSRSLPKSRCRLDIHCPGR